MPGAGDDPEQWAEEAGDKPSAGQEGVEVFVSDPKAIPGACEG
jgi:hypothetical protein